MPEDPQLKYTISGEADTGPIEQAEQATGNLKETLGSTAGELRHLTASGREGREVIHGLEAAMRGGANGAGQMAMGVGALARAAANLMAGGWIGAITVAVGLLAGALFAMKSKADDAGKGMDDAGKKADDFAKHLESLKKSAEESLKPLNDQIKQIDDHFADLEKRITEANASYDRLAKSTKNVADAQSDLAKANAIEGAGGDEKKIAAINREFDARHKLTDATEAVNVVGQKELDLKTKLDAANTKAAETAAVAAEENKRVSDQQEKSAAATQAAAKATEYYEQVLEKQKGAEDARRSAIARADLTLGAGHLAPNAIAALPESLTAKEAAVQVAQADEARKAAIGKAKEEGSTLSGLQEGAKGANEKAEKDAAAAQTAELSVENEQLVTQQDMKAALLRLEIAQKDLAAAIRENKAKEDSDKAKSDAKDQRDEERTEKADAAASEKTQRADDKAAAKMAKDDATHTREDLTEAAKEARKHNEAFHHFVKAITEAHRENKITMSEGTKVAVNAARETRETHKQSINSLSYNQSP